MKTFLFAVFILFIAAASANDFYKQYYEEFEKFKIKFDKVYKNDDVERLRMKIFAENVDEYRKKHHHDLRMPSYGVDFYSDLLPHEVPLVKKHEYKPKPSDVKFMHKHTPNRKDQPTFYVDDEKNDYGYQPVYDDEMPTVPPTYSHPRKVKVRYQ